MPSEPTPPHSLIVPPGRRWSLRRRRTLRGRFEIAVIGGGMLALLLAGVLPGLSPNARIAPLVITALVMLFVARATGPAPALVATLFAPLIVALTDPHWSFAYGIGDFSTADVSFQVLIAYGVGSMLGVLWRHWGGRVSRRVKLAAARR